MPAHAADSSAARGDAKSERPLATAIVVVVGPRVRRALARVDAQVSDESVETAAVFTTYDPRRIAGAFAAGLGAASFGQGSEATGRAVMALINWGDREALQYEVLPHKLLIATTREAVHPFEWPVAPGARRVARWRQGSFAAEVVRHRVAGQIDVFMYFRDHKTAVVSTKTGVLHPYGLRCAEAITRLSTTPPR